MRSLKGRQIRNNHVWGCLRLQVNKWRWLHIRVWREFFWVGSKNLLHSHNIQEIQGKVIMVSRLSQKSQYGLSNRFLFAFKSKHLLGQMRLILQENNNFGVLICVRLLCDVLRLNILWSGWYLHSHNSHQGLWSGKKIFEPNGATVERMKLPLLTSKRSTSK